MRFKYCFIIDVLFSIHCGYHWLKWKKKNVLRKVAHIKYFATVKVYSLVSLLYLSIQCSYNGYGLVEMEDKKCP
jgi:hypothetical protein